MGSEQVVEYRLLWKFPGYRVGTDGSVWSRWTSGRCAKLGPRWGRVYGRPGTDGVPRVTLKSARGREVVRVDELVLGAFAGGGVRGCVPDHRDGDPANCARENLEWGTCED